jgi:hypothetical protein
MIKEEYGQLTRNVYQLITCYVYFRSEVWTRAVFWPLTWKTVDLDWQREISNSRNFFTGITPTYNDRLLRPSFTRNHVEPLYRYIC